MPKKSKKKARQMKRRAERRVQALSSPLEPGAGEPGVTHTGAAKAKTVPGAGAQLLARIRREASDRRADEERRARAREEARARREGLARARGR